VEDRRRFILHLSLTPDEVHRLREAAAAEVRFISNYVAHLIAKDLARDLRKERATRRARPALGQPDDKRTSYDVSVELPSQEYRKLRCRARDERSRMSSYVAKVVLEECGHPGAARPRPKSGIQERASGVVANTLGSLTS
jgi:hypothetical protein